MDTDDEHIEVGSRGSSNKGDNLQLNFKLGGDEIEETIDKLPPFDMQDLPTLLRDENWLKETTKEELAQYYQEHPSSNDRREFLRDHIFMGIFQSYRKRTSFDMEYIGFHRDSWHPEYDEIKLYSGNWSNMKTQTDTDLEFIQNAISELIEKDEYMQSPYEKMTTLQQHIHNGNINRDVDRIVFSHLDIYIVSSAEIIESLQKLSTEKEKEEYIQTIFDEGITSFEIDELSLMLEKRETGLHFYVGDYESPTLEYDYPWWMITREIEGLILSRYFDPTIQIPTQDEQMTAVYKSVEEFQKGNYYSQEEIDRILTRGSSFSEGKLRIYDVLSKDGNQKDDIAFLKNEYGTGGSSPAVGHINEDHGSKGITLNKGYIGEYDLEITLPWSKVRKRLKELIAAKRYLNKKEMEEYPNYLANKFMEDTRIDDEDDEIEEEEILKEYQYEIGDIIHIGIDEHEVIEINDKIILRDLSFPLFSNEYSKDELNKVVSENPLNGHLLRPINDIPQMLDIPINDNEEADRTPWQNHYSSNIENLLENIHDHWSYETIRDRDTDDYEAFSLLNETVDNFMANGMTDTFFLNLYSDDEEFHNIVIDELFDKTYNDIYDKNGNINEIEYFEKSYEEYILEETLGNIHIDDITVNIDSLGKLIAKDDDNTWYDDAFYDFLLNEAIVSHGDDTPVSNSLYSSLQYYSNQRKGAVEKAEVNKPNQESESVQENQEYLPSETKEEVKKENYQIHDNDFQVGTPKERYQNNVAAIQLLFSLEKEERNTTREEQEVLAKYVGWGGLADVFDDSKNSWVNEFLELHNLLDEDEYSSARESTLTAFYTSPVIIKSMYQAIENMGFKYGNILEPSCATGNFLGMLPETLKDSKLYGIELDSISGRIAQKLYPNSNIAVDGYENVNLPDSFFDVAIGNIPFGQFKVNDKRYDKLNFSIHDYFFAKTIDKVRPGGVIAFVTSRYTMDKANSLVRKYINEKAEFIGAIRLPNNAFKDSAGTKVVSDIIFLQKRDRPIIVESDWLYTEQDENENVINSYFINNPEMVLGTISTTKALYGRETLDVVPYDDISLEDSLNGAIMNIYTQIDENLIDESLEKDEDDETIPADPEVRNFSFTLYDGDIYYRENSIMRKINTTVTAANRITGLIEIRESVRELIRLQTEDYSDYDIQKEQDNLNNIYDVYTKKYGLINSRGNSIAFRDDSLYFLLASLEILNEDGTLQKKADMFTKRTIRKKEVVTNVDTALEALPVSLAEKGRVDIFFMAELCRKSEDEVINDLKGVIYQEPYLKGMMDSDKSVYLTSDEYLSGNIRDKLVIAKAAAEIDKKFEGHVQALTQALPEPLTASEISVRIGATWIDMDDYRTFIFELLDTSRYSQQYIDVLYSNVADRWNIKNKSSDRGNVKAERTYGTNRVNAYKLIEDCLNLKSTKIYDTEYDDEGKKISVLTKKETVIAQQKQDAIKEAFKEWIWKDSDRRERLSGKYNKLFNSVRPREYDGSHLSFPNMNPEIVLREHQKDAVARILYGNNALLAHVVGAGKTYTMAAAAMELKRLGISHKQMFIVPNHLVGQWGTEFLQLYPSANVLVATKKDFQKNNRKRFCSRIATGEYDAIIMGHSTFEKVPMSVERQRQQIESEIDAITKGLADLKSSNGERFTVKQLEKTKKSLRNRLDKLNSDSRKDDVVCFEELGVDRIFVDEAHNYKNLFLYTKMTNVAGIAQTEAQKSSDLFMKCRYLDEITFNKGIVFATGTPISNSMTEMYSNQRYLQYGTLKKLGLENFDAWASTFGETINAIELTPEGKGYRMKTRFAKFYNLPELISIFKEVADIKTADMLQLPVPEAHYHSISVKPSEIQKEIVESLAERAEEIRNGSVDPTIDNMLKITNDGRKLALDQRLVNDMLPEYEGSKVNACVRNVIDIYHNTTADKSTQLVFCDMSTPRPNIFNVYDEVRKKLIEEGIPESEIDFIHNANTDIQKSDMFAKVRNGSIRILLGSTSKMGAGMNVQTLLYATHDLDCPWRPSDLEQRAGRIVRQGNTNENVYIYRYVTEETFDAYLYVRPESRLINCLANYLD